MLKSDYEHNVQPNYSVNLSFPPLPLSPFLLFSKFPLPFSALISMHDSDPRRSFIPSNSPQPFSPCPSPRPPGSVPLGLCYSSLPVSFPHSALPSSVVRSTGCESHTVHGFASWLHDQLVKGLGQQCNSNPSSRMRGAREWHLFHWVMVRIQ